MVAASNDPLSADYRARLVSTLQEEGAIRTPRIAQAFATVPREAFVSSFYDREDKQPTWERYTSENMDERDWLALLYQDRSLVTQIQEAVPTSSSSMPSCMAQMLEALDVHPGIRVLEIGTGTGYNAALMAHMVGTTGRVVTVDIDEALVQSARVHLAQAGFGHIQVLCGDGADGYPPAAPYDRIMLTASTSFIARTWYHQLAPGGRLVGALQGTLGASGFLVIEKTTGSALGQFLTPPLHFMSLRTSETPQDLPSPRELFGRPVGSEVHLRPDHAFLTLLQDQAFRWFLQWWWRHPLKINRVLMKTEHRNALIILMDQCNQTILQLKQGNDGWWHGKHHGEFPLWRTIEQAVETFSDLGKPEWWQYQVHLNEAEAWLEALDGSGQSHRICDLYG